MIYVNLACFFFMFLANVFRLSNHYRYFGPKGKYKTIDRCLGGDWEVMSSFLVLISETVNKTLLRPPPFSHLILERDCVLHMAMRTLRGALSPPGVSFLFVPMDSVALATWPRS